MDGGSDFQLGFAVALLTNATLYSSVRFGKAVACSNSKRLFAYEYRVFCGVGENLEEETSSKGVS